MFFVIQSKGFHDHHRPSTKSSATSLKRKGHAKRTSTASKMLPSQTSIEQCFKTEQAELRPAFSFDPSGHPPGTYWWDQNEVHMMQPLNGKPLGLSRKKNRTFVYLLTYMQNCAQITAHSWSYSVDLDFFSLTGG